VLASVFSVPEAGIATRSDIEISGKLLEAFYDPACV